MASRFLENLWACVFGCVKSTIGHKIGGYHSSVAEVSGCL
jgi:hypothetical protein